MKSAMIKILSFANILVFMTNCGTSHDHNSALSDSELRFGEFLQESVVIYHDEINETVVIRHCAQNMVAEDGEPLTRLHCTLTPRTEILQKLGVETHTVDYETYRDILRSQIDLQDTQPMLLEHQSLQAQIETITRDINELAEILSPDRLRTLTQTHETLSQQLNEIQLRLNQNEARQNLFDSIPLGLDESQREFYFIARESLVVASIQKEELRLLLLPFINN